MLPPLYARWTSQFIGPIPEETNATCSNCAMCAPGGDQSPGVFFSPETKCCTYIPDIPNYLAGRILVDDDPQSAAGRSSLAARIDARVGVTPVGVYSPPSFRLKYDHSKMNSFGHSRSLRCPHYLPDQGGGCGIWKHRTSVCATWFCKHVRGAAGARFWQLLNRLLREVERSIACWSVLELGIGGDALEKLFPLAPALGQNQTLSAAEVDDAVDPRQYQRQWGAWLGREQEFYERSARLVEPLDWSGVLAICGPDVRIMARQAADNYQALQSTESAEALRTGPFQILGFQDDRVRINSYSSLDPVEMPERLFHLLRYFDGRPARAALSAIEAEHGLRVHENLVRRLTDFGILAPAEKS